MSLFPRGDTAISGLWVEPHPFAVPTNAKDAAPGKPGIGSSEPLGYAVQDSDRDPALVAVFGLGNMANPQLLAPLIIEDPNSMIEDAHARASKESGAARPDQEASPESAGLSLDMEGIAPSSEGVKLEPTTSAPPFYGRGFWVVCEGKGRLVDGESPKRKGKFKQPNLLVQLEANKERGSLEVARVVELPDEVRRHQEPQGFEGVALGSEGHVYVAFQRGWGRAGDPQGHTRVGRFDPGTGTWTFAHYRLDAYPPSGVPPSGKETAHGPARGREDDTAPEDAWVGISELSRLPDSKLLVLERDNQHGEFAKIQRLYAIDVDEASFRPSAPFPVLSKTMVFDLIDEGVVDPRYGEPIRKPEGVGILGPGRLLLLADDDGKRGSKKGTPFFVLHLR